MIWYNIIIYIFIETTLKINIRLNVKNSKFIKFYRIFTAINKNKSNQKYNIYYINYID